MMINEEKIMIVVEDMIGDMVVELMGVHVSPIKPIVEHAYYGHPQWKRKTPSCGTH